MKIALNQNTLYSNNKIFWQNIIVILLSLAVLLNDWIIIYSSFGDFILAIIVFLLFILGKIKIHNRQIKVLLLVFTILTINILSSELINTEFFSLYHGIIASIKLMFYLITIFIVYNFIIEDSLSNLLLRVNTFIAVLSVFLGILFVVLIYYDKTEMLDFFWTFTRKDTSSYYFFMNESIVRSRSVFSEPAHFGYYLNIILFSNILSERKINLAQLFIIVFGIITTLSYSMIIIMLIVGVTVVIHKIINNTIKWHNLYYIVIAVSLFILYFYRDLINETLYTRTIDIISGEDKSATMRLVGSWSYVSGENLLFGNGIGHTPPVTNVFAYSLSEFGLVGFIPFLIFTLNFLKKGIPVFLFFVLMNVAKGGYLSPIFWFLILSIYIYMDRNHSLTQSK